MSDNNQDSFTPEVMKELQYYVYRLIDPRNGETFYVGKGKGNRVFAHARGAIISDSQSEKMNRIREIKLAHLEVGHVIHRHRLSEDMAFAVEGALLDAYPGTTNIMGGHGNDDCGCMHSRQIIKNYSARIADFKHKAIIISVNRSALESSLYDATRFAWRLNKSKAECAEIVLATVQGLIEGVFVAEEWLEATAGNFPGRETIEGRFGFNGKNAPKEVEDLYLEKRIPEEFRKRGASNPIKYTW